MFHFEDVRTKWEKELPQVKFKTVREAFILENPADLPTVAEWLKHSREFGIDYLSSVTAVDYLEFLECVYHFYSMQRKAGPIVLKVRVPMNHPKVPSLVPLFRSAELQEREAYDLFGVQFENHPDLRRLFLWEGFEGFPLRKTYVQEDSETLEMADIEWLDKHNVQIPEEMRKVALELHAHGKRAVASQEGKEKS